MANISARAYDLLQMVRKVSDRFVKDTMPSTMDEAARFDYKRIEDYQMINELFDKYYDLVKDYADKIDTMGTQLNDIQDRIRKIESRLDKSEKND